jgi:AcrR family transcriptional regulator
MGIVAPPAVGSDSRVVRLQRERIVAAMVRTIAEHGYEGASVRAVCRSAGVSLRTFYECFESFEECFLAVLDRGMEVMAGVMLGAFAGQEDWLDALLEAEAAVLSFLDGEPQLARVLLVDALGAGLWALERRQDNVTVLRDMIVERFKDTPVGGDFPPLAANGVMASLLGIMHEHLLHRGPEPLISLLGPLMGVIVTPYLDAEGVAREVRRGEELAEKIQAEAHARRRVEGELSQDEHSDPGHRGGQADALVQIPALLCDARAARVRLCVWFLAEQGERGLSPSNREIAAGIGIASKGQISRLLTRLCEAGILSKHAHGAGLPNAWQLTPYGQELALVLERAENTK